LEAVTIPTLRLDPELDAFRGAVQDFLAEEMAPDRLAGHLDPTDLTGLDEEFEREHHRRAGARGFLGISVPAEHGGGGRPPSWKSVYMFEAAYRDAPSIDSAITLCGPPITAFGTTAQRERWLPPMVRGELTGCIAYTEHEAGSDLAALSTVAVPDGSNWRLTGTKALVTAAHKADVCITVARTDPDAPVRRGTSMFLVALPSDGVTVRRRATLNGWTLSEIEFADALVPREGLLGERHGGWRQLAAAVAEERSGMAHLGWATQVVERLAAWVDGTDGDGRAEEALARLQVDLATGLRLAKVVLDRQDRGESVLAEAAASKVWSTELLQRIARVGGELLGVDAARWEPLLADAAAVPLGGRIGWEAVERIHPAVSVGANEVQRDLIARLALGLPVRRG
jgi:alkylation response protein AidB-like acyl-CoA dehydrogenase